MPGRRRKASDIMKITLKAIAVGLFILPLLGVWATRAGGATGTATPGDDFDAAATFKAKCQMCHGPAAAKFFDASKDEAAYVQAILKGVKTEKPPAMPSFEAKGTTESQAKALAAYMKSLRQ